MDTIVEEKINVIENAEEKALAVTTAASVLTADILQQIKGLVIADQEHCVWSTHILKTVKSAYKTLEARRRDTVKPINDAKAKVQGLFKPDLEKYLEAERILKKAIGSYQAAEEKIRQAEQEKLRLKAEAEERKRKAVLLEQARKAAEKGNAEKAEAKKQEAEVFHAPVAMIPKADPVQGISQRSIWRARVVDKSKLPLEYLLPDMQMIQKMAQATKGQVPISGVEFFEDSSITVR